MCTIYTCQRGWTNTSRAEIQNKTESADSRNSTSLHCYTHCTKYRKNSQSVNSYLSGKMLFGHEVEGEVWSLTQAEINMGVIIEGEVAAFIRRLQTITLPMSLQETRESRASIKGGGGGGRNHGFGGRARRWVKEKPVKGTKNKQHNKPPQNPPPPRPALLLCPPPAAARRGAPPPPPKAGLWASGASVV